MKHSVKQTLAITLTLALLVQGSMLTHASSENLLPIGEISAKGAILIDAQSGAVLYGQNHQQQLPMASTTKIMTSLIVLEQGNLDAEFIVDEEAIRVEGSSMGLQIGDQVTLRALCYGMLLSSGNDAAGAAAVKVSGSIQQFVDTMNNRAAQIGMKNTNFCTPSGLDAPQHYSTAYDMALLMRTAMQNPDFAQITAQSSVRLAYGNPPYDRWLSNHNKLLKLYSYAIGGKTGFTEKAGRCLVSVAQKDGVTLICVTLGTEDDWNTHKRLFDAGFAALTALELSSFLEGVTVPVTGAEVSSIALRTPSNHSLTLPKSQAQALQAQIYLPPFVYAPVQVGDYLGEIHYMIEGQTLWKESLIAAQDAPALHIPKQGESLWQKIKEFCKI